MLVFLKVLLSTKIMKNILAFLLLVSGNALAEPVEIVTSADGRNTWMAYPETFVATATEYSMLAELVVEKSAGKQLYVSVAVKSCDSGKGTIYGRENLKLMWTKLSNFDVQSSVTVADVIAQTLCTVGQDRRQKNSLKMT